MRTQQMDILRLLDELSQLIDNTPSLGPITWGLDRDEISMQIAKVRASLPQELKVAVSTVRESERIIDSAREDANMTLEKGQAEAARIVEDAKREAERMLEQGRLQQERMVAESEILKLSKAQSEELRNAAERDAIQMKRGAEKYAYDVLAQLENQIGKLMTTIERGKNEIQKDPNQALAGRDKARMER
jgi:cell division septum initiation protein DivIVA